MPASDQPVSDIRNPFAQLEAFERAVYERRDAQAGALLLQLLDDLRAAPGQGLFGAHVPAELRGSVYTTIAAAVASLLRSPQFDPDAAYVHRLMIAKPALESLFINSGWGDGAHLVRYFAAQAARQTPHAVESSAFALALDHATPRVLDQVLALPPERLLPLLVGWLASDLVISEQGELNRGRLLHAGARIASVPLSRPLLLALGNAWMLCSYASDAGKHEIKRAFNDRIRAFAAAENLVHPCTARRLVERPTVLVAAERFSTDHAMFRCFAPAIRQLRERFRLVLMADAGDIDATGKSLFDQVLSFDSNRVPLGGLVGSAARVQPDIVYFPSLGMSWWTVLLANLRLAPIQVMTTGHPATSMSDCIDYALIHRDMRAAAGAFSETVIVRDGPEYHSHRSDLPAVLPTRTRADDGAIHIAVIGIHAKLSYRLIGLCARLQRSAGRPLRLHFFAAGIGMNQDAVPRRLLQALPDAQVHPYYSYPDLLQALAQCDFALATFPFGNTNSTVDACLAGLPVVAMVGREPHGQMDRGILRLLDLPAWLCADSDDAYFAAALKLARDDDLRREVAASLRRADPRSRLDTVDAQHRDFVQAIDWIYREHEAIQASGLKLLDAGQALPPLIA